VRSASTSEARGALPWVERRGNYVIRECGAHVTDRENPRLMQWTLGRPILSVTPPLRMRTW